MRLVPGLHRGLLRLQVVEGEVALPAEGEEDEDNEREDCDY
jgi:hypothetical protein